MSEGEFADDLATPITPKAPSDESPSPKSKKSSLVEPMLNEKPRRQSTIFNRKRKIFSVYEVDTPKEISFNLTKDSTSMAYAVYLKQDIIGMEFNPI